MYDAGTFNLVWYGRTNDHASTDTNKFYFSGLPTTDATKKFAVFPTSGVATVLSTGFAHSASGLVHPAGGFDPANSTAVTARFARGTTTVYTSYDTSCPEAGIDHTPKELIMNACLAKGDKVFYKAALLSGPPGVGKTSTAKVVLKHAGYDIVELNASDTRSEKAIKSMAGDMVGNQSIADFATAEGVGGKGFKGKNGKMALIMDEVDGMSAGDRGGVGMLVKIIADAKMPVICICNDRQSQKLKSLANHCLDLRFRRPANGEIKSALRRVVASEGYHDVDEAVLDKLAESCNADIRQMLNLLQIWRPRDGAAKLDGETVQNNLKSAFKDLDVGPWDVADRFFKAGNEDFEQKLRYYFVDNSMTPLLVHENYLSCQPFLPQRFMQAPPKFQDNWKFNQLAQAGDFLATGDVISQKVMGSQNFALMPLHGALSCVAPGAMMKGNGPGRLQFPSWLGRNSTATKRQRLLREATSHMSGTISASKCSRSVGV